MEANSTVEQTTPADDGFFALVDDEPEALDEMCRGLWCLATKDFAQGNNGYCLATRLTVSDLETAETLEMAMGLALQNLRREIQHCCPDEKIVWRVI
jgi:hypothetical protein